jgi:hypothetical protein
MQISIYGPNLRRALRWRGLKLMVDGGWSELKLETRYAHLMPAGHEDEIRRWWGLESAAKKMCA